MFDAIIVGLNSFRFFLYLVRSLIMLFFHHREIDYMFLICGPLSSFWLSGNIIPAISHDIPLVVFLALCCVPSYPVPHMRCFSIDIMALARRLLLASFPLLCVVFLRAWYAHLCCFPSGDSSTYFICGRSSAF